MGKKIPLSIRVAFLFQDPWWNRGKKNSRQFFISVCLVTCRAIYKLSLKTFTSKEKQVRPTSRASKVHRRLGRLIVNWRCLKCLFLLHSEVIFCLDETSCRMESKMGQNTVRFMPTFERATSAGARALLSCQCGKGGGGSGTGVGPGSRGAAQPLSGMGSKWEASDSLCRGRGVRKVVGRSQGRELGLSPSPSRSSLGLSSLSLCPLNM